MQFKALTLAALASAAFAQSGGDDLVTVLSNQTELTNLTSFLSQYPDLVTTLSGLTNVTLLAPDNAAFALFQNSSAFAAAASDAGLIQGLLTYHVLNGTYVNITETGFIPTALTNVSYTNVTGGQVVEASEDDGNVTFISGLLASSSVVSTTPLNFSGGVIHVLNNLLTLPQSISNTATELNLSSAVGALLNTSLAETVDTTPDITIFIPNNDAFQSIGSALQNLTTENLTSILQYHVVPSVAYSTDLSNGTSLPTLLEGSNVTVRIQDGDVFVNGARVVIPNVLVANGVIHVIDEVLNPLNATAAPGDGDDEGTPAFSGASSATEAPYTSNAPTRTGTINTESAAATATSATSSGGAYVPRITGAVEAAFLLGGALLL